MGQDSAVQDLQPAEVARLLSEGRIVLVDVREAAEFQAERIKGALLFPLSSLDVSTLPQDQARAIVFQCGSGKRSLMAAQKYLDAGHGSAMHLAGGIAAWKSAGLPVISAG